MTDEQNLGWWTIAGSELIGALRRAEAGESADLIYAELYANSEIERFTKEDEQ